MFSLLEGKYLKTKEALNVGTCDVAPNMAAMTSRKKLFQRTFKIIYERLYSTTAFSRRNSKKFVRNILTHEQ